MLLNLRVCLLPLLLFLLAASWGWSETTLANGYAVRLWQTEDGLPQNLVTTGTQTRDGYLWFGTQSGLARFDGERFQIFDSANTAALTDRRISSLFEDASQTLWIGHESGAVTRYQAGHFNPVLPAPGNDGAKIIGLGSDPHGHLWAMHLHGAVSSLDGAAELPSLIAPARPGNMSWARGPDGSIWLVENGTPARLQDQALVPVTLPDPQQSNYTFALAASADGGAWILCDGRIRKWDGARWSEDRGAFPWGADALSACLELSDGTLAVGTLNSGLFLIFADGRHAVRLDRENALPQNWVRFLLEDQEGNLWAGIGSAGLVSVRPTAFGVLNAPDQWEGCSVLAVAPGRDNALWIGTDGAGLYHYSHDTWTRFGAAEGLANPFISATVETPAGEVWAGNFWWGGPFRLQNGQFQAPPSVDETFSAVVALVPDPATGDLLVGNREGLLRLSPSTATWLIHSPGGMADDVSALVVAPDGTLWCGFAQGGLARWRDGETTFFRQADGLGSDAIYSLMAEADGTLWIGTADAGLTRYRDGQFSVLGREHGLIDQAICSIQADDLGYFWLGTQHGIQRIARTALNACAGGATPTFSSQVYNRSDGLPVVEFLGGRQGAASRTPDGRLWFANSRGLVSVDPARITSNPRPPPVLIESVEVDGQILTSASIELAPDHERLAFRYAGLSFTAPDKVRFRYRLEGLDKDWVEAGSQRTATYSQLPAGSYVFQVIACNNDGVWNPAGAAIAFTVAPFFWQTWWFAGSCTLLVLSAVALAVRSITRARLKRRIALLEQRHLLELERARIARDIHDDVGTSLTRISMLSQSAPDVPHDPQQAAGLLGRINETATEMTRAFDEIVWAVDPRHDTLDSLVSYMGKFAQDFLEAGEVRCRLDLPISLPAWTIPSDQRHHLFLAFKEALNNALKHGHATVVHIRLRLQDRAFVLSIEDNGQGFDPAAPPAPRPDRPRAGHGLANLQQRLARIGGRCYLQSSPGKGTTVTFTVSVGGAAASTPPRPLP